MATGAPPVALDRRGLYVRSVKSDAPGIDTTRNQDASGGRTGSEAVRTMTSSPARSAGRRSFRLAPECSNSWLVRTKLAEPARSSIVAASVGAFSELAIWFILIPALSSGPPLPARTYYHRAEGRLHRRQACQIADSSNARQAALLCMTRNLFVVCARCSLTYCTSAVTSSQLRFHFLQFRVRGVQLLVELNNGCSDEIVKNVRGSVEAFVKRCMLVGYVKSVQAVEIDEVISTGDQERLPFAMRFNLRVGESGFNQDNPWAVFGKIKVDSLNPPYEAAARQTEAR